MVENDSHTRMDICRSHGSRLLVRIHERINMKKHDMIGFKKTKTMKLEGFVCPTCFIIIDKCDMCNMSFSGKSKIIYCDELANQHICERCFKHE